MHQDNVWVWLNANNQRNEICFRVDLKADKPNYEKSFIQYDPFKDVAQVCDSQGSRRWNYSKKIRKKQKKELLTDKLH